MHRSGTTLVSKLLNDSGVFQGVLRDHNNEAFHFLSINQEVMQKSGFNWLEPGEPSKMHWTNLTAGELYAEHFKLSSGHYLKTHFFTNQKWGWKDPRNTFTYKMWLSVFPRARILHVIRNGVDVALSLQKRNQVAHEVHDIRLDDLGSNFRLWEKYVEQGKGAAEFTEHYLEISYENLLRKDEDTLRKLASFAEVNLEKELEMIRPASHHQKPVDQDLVKMAAESKIYRRWYS